MFVRRTRPSPLVQEHDTRTLAPAVDILDDGESYAIVMELPGVKRDDVALDLEHRTLAVRAKRDSYSGETRMLYDGRGVGHDFERRFAVGPDVERDKVSAQLEDGVLTITLPRRVEERKRSIELEVQ
jgi:HSP20 family protein